MITLTEKAKAKLNLFLEGKNPAEWGLRIRDLAGGKFNLSLEKLDQLSTQDLLLEGGDFKVVVDRASQGKFSEGATIDYVDTAWSSGFKVELKNSQASTGGGPDLSNPVVKKINDVIQNEINPAIASHGGMTQLIDYKDRKVYLRFGGGCHGCGMVDATLKNGISLRLKEEVPEIEEVIDATDHSTGTNPYFSAAR